MTVLFQQQKKLKNKTKKFKKILQKKTQKI
jgi:hypothetical protein